MTIFKEADHAKLSKQHIFHSSNVYLTQHRQIENSMDNQKTCYEALNNQTSVSPSMQKRLDRISALINEGYTLKRGGGFDIQLHNSAGVRRNTLNPWKSPGGFSWIAFFFPSVVCCQIREWSYFYWIAILSVVSVLLSSIMGSDQVTSGGIILSVVYGCLFPYMRYLAIKEEKKEFLAIASFFLGIVLTIAAIIPAIILAVII